MTGSKADLDASFTNCLHLELSAQRAHTFSFTLGIFQWTQFYFMFFYKSSGNLNRQVQRREIGLFYFQWTYRMYGSVNKCSCFCKVMLMVLSNCTANILSGCPAQIYDNDLPIQKFEFSWQAKYCGKSVHCSTSLPTFF